MITERRIVDGKPPQVMSEEEIAEFRGISVDEAKNEELIDEGFSADEAGSSESSLEKTMGEFGRDYGLIFVGEYNSISALYVALNPSDAVKIKTYPYRKLLFHNNDLYFTTRSFVRKWPNEWICDDDLLLSGLTEYKGKFLVTAPSAGEIYDSNFKRLDYGLKGPMQIAVLNGGIYFTEDFDGLGLCRVPRESIKKTGDWSNALTEFDNKLYFGGHDRVIYSYDGNKVEIITRVNFPVWSLHGVKEKDQNVLYASGYEKMGILRVNLDNPLVGQKSVVKNKPNPIHNIGSIAAAPIGYIKEMIKHGNDN